MTLINSTILEVRNSRWKYVALLLAALGFVVIGVFFLLDSEDSNNAVGWMGIIFFGSGIPIFVWQFLDSRPRVVLSEQGVLDRTLGVGVIPWAEISSAYRKRMQSNDFICLVLRDPAKWTSRFSPTQKKLISVNRKLGFQELNVNLAGTRSDPDLVLDVILKKSAEYGGGDGV